MKRWIQIAATSTLLATLSCAKPKVNEACDDPGEETCGEGHTGVRCVDSKWTEFCWGCGTSDDLAILCLDESQCGDCPDSL